MFNSIEEEVEYLNSAFPEEYVERVLKFNKGRNPPKTQYTEFKFNNRKASTRLRYEFRKTLFEYLKNESLKSSLDALRINDHVWYDYIRTHGEMITNLANSVSYIGNQTNYHGPAVIDPYSSNYSNQKTPIDLQDCVVKSTSALNNLNVVLYEFLTEFCKKYPVTALEFANQDHLFETIRTWMFGYDDLQMKLLRIIIEHNPNLISEITDYKFTNLVGEFPLVLNYLDINKFRKLELSNYYSSLPILDIERREIAADKFVDTIDLRNYEKIPHLILSKTHWNLIKLKFFV